MQGGAGIAGAQDGLPCHGAGEVPCPLADGDGDHEHGDMGVRRPCPPVRPGNRLVRTPGGKQGHRLAGLHRTKHRVERAQFEGTVHVGHAIRRPSGQHGDKPARVIALGIARAELDRALKPGPAILGTVEQQEQPALGEVGEWVQRVEIEAALGMGLRLVLHVGGVEGFALGEKVDPEIDSNAARCSEIYHAVGCDYFLLPLQLDSDYQIRVHSPFLGVEGFMDRVIKSFAETSEAPTRLLVKLHPLDSGLINWRKFARASARRHGVSERLDFIDGGDLQSLIAGARGVVVVNSTVGMLSLENGRPTLATGTAIYNMPGLTHQGGLDTFWTDPVAPDMALMADFRRVVLHQTQVNGGFFSKEAIQRAVSGTVPRIEARLPDALVEAARGLREGAEEDGRLAPVY